VCPSGEPFAALRAGRRRSENICCSLRRHYPDQVRRVYSQPVGRRAPLYLPYDTPSLYGLSRTSPAVFQI
jgi:hypothetical protein